MGQTIITMDCIDQDLIGVDMPLIASGGLHENYVKFSFCPLWDGFVKTAVFYKTVSKPYYMILDNADMCEIPHEVTDDSGTIYIGVFGVNGDVTRTSKVFRYQIKKGAVTGTLLPPDPTPDVWEQLLSAYDRVLDKVEESNSAQSEFINTANKAVYDCNVAKQECYDAIAVLNYYANDLDGGDPTIEEPVDDEQDLDGGSPY